jgi:predicted heme/steroid binding protein
MSNDEFPEEISAMTNSELASYDGRDGRKAYVSVNGNIYDVSASPLWQNGDHQGAHQAGADLTEALKGAPHVRAVIERFPVVGKIEEAAPPAATGGNKGLIIAVVVAALLALAFILAR